MEILSIIPARGGSKEIPLKNLVPVNGKPLLDYTVTASLKSKLVNRTIVSSDSQKILKCAKTLGAETMVRPKKLATDSAHIEPLILNILNTLKKNEQYIPDIIVLLQNTSPLRNEKHIDESIKLFFKKKFDSVLSGFNSHYFLWNKRNDLFHPINYNLKERPNRQIMRNQFCENGAIYITKYLAFKKTKSRLSGKIGLYEMPEYLSLQIDSKFDLFLIEQILKRKGNLYEKN